MKIKLLLMIVAALTLLGCEQEKVTEKKEVIKFVKIMDIKRVSGLTKIRTPGTVRASKRADLSFDVPGRIVSLNAKEGAKVNKGDVIATLDDSDYKNKYQSARANLKEAEATFKRYSSLIKGKTISKSLMDTAEKNYNIAKADMKVAEKALNNTKLKAYFTGTIVVRHVENFQNIQAKQSIVSIEDKSALEIIVHAPEAALAENNLDDVVSLQASFSAIPDKTFPLKFKEVSEKIDQATRTYAIVLSMESTAGYNLLSGMTANVDIEINNGGDGAEKIMVPVTSVMGDIESKSFVWIYSKEKGSVSKREIVIGEMSGENIQVLSGLNFDEVIVTAGVNYLVENMKVKPLVGKVGGGL